MRFTYLMTSFHILHNTRFDELTTATPPPTPHQKTSAPTPTPTPAPAPSSAVAPSHLLDSRAWLRKFPFPIMATLSSSVCVCVCVCNPGAWWNAGQWKCHWSGCVCVCVCVCIGVPVERTNAFVCSVADAPGEAFISSFDANDVRHKPGMH